MQNSYIINRLVLNNYRSYEKLRIDTNSVKIVAKSTIAKNAGKIIPIIATVAPLFPKSFFPTKIDVFAAIIPGKDALIA